jgi:hypothetical protein
VRMVPPPARLTRAAYIVIALIALFAAAAACGDDRYTGPGVIIETLTPTPPSAAFSDVLPYDTTPTPDATTVADTPAPPPPQASPEPAATMPPTVHPGPAAAPASGRWIEVDVTTFTVRLMDGENVVRQIAPVAVGEEIDSGNYLSTQTGLFHVYSMIEPLAYNAPFDTYISHWIGFDPALDNGFHSFLKDEHGNVVDASTGRVSNGCIRASPADARAIYDFAEIGMPVLVRT